MHLYLWAHIEVSHLPFLQQLEMCHARKLSKHVLQVVLFCIS